ncbi:4Fe-4S binding protein [Eisenbergiella tayi]
MTDACRHCGTCYEICPFSAVKKKKEEIDRR